MSEQRAWSQKNDQAADLVAACKAQSGLIDAALSALEAMSVPLKGLAGDLDARPRKPLVGYVDRLYRLVESAMVGTDNLLASPLRLSDTSLKFRTIGRQASGAVDLRTIEVDRVALTLTDPLGRGAPLTLDRLADAVRESSTGMEKTTAARAALDQMTAQVGRSISRLSLLKARLDLQKSFLSSVMDADPASPFIRLESHLNHATARDLAQETRRQLSGRSLMVASGNRRVLSSLLDTDPADAT